MSTINAIIVSTYAWPIIMSSTLQNTHKLIYMCMPITVEPRTLKEHIAMISIGSLLSVSAIIISTIYLTTLCFLNCTCESLEFDKLNLGLIYTLCDSF